MPKIRSAKRQVSQCRCNHSDSTISWQTILKQMRTGTIYLPVHQKKPFYWLCSPLGKKISKYSCDILPATLSSTPDATAFEKYFSHEPDVYAQSFYNLNGDTRLVIPEPRVKTNCANLYTFLKTAQQDHQVGFWKEVAKQISSERSKLVDQEKLFVSTHGNGEAWLHVRISKVAKYYGRSQQQFGAHGCIKWPLESAD